MAMLPLLLLNVIPTTGPLTSVGFIEGQTSCEIYSQRRRPVRGTGDGGSQATPLLGRSDCSCSAFTTAPLPLIMGGALNGTTSRTSRYLPPPGSTSRRSLTPSLPARGTKLLRQFGTPFANALTSTPRSPRCRTVLILICSTIYSSIVSSRIVSRGSNSSGVLLGGLGTQFRIGIPPS